MHNFIFDMPFEPSIPDKNHLQKQKHLQERQFPVPSVNSSLVATPLGILNFRLTQALAAFEAFECLAGTAGGTAIVGILSAWVLVAMRMVPNGMGPYIPQQISSPSPPPRRDMVIGAFGFCARRVYVSLCATQVTRLRKESLPAAQS
jgi:hypothetical protein